jgi:nicotinate phosphoribosyltransferase
MVTGGNDPAFTGVYKLSAHEDSKGRLIPAMKFSDNPEKTTNPGVKQVWRLTDAEGKAIADVMGLVAPEGFNMAAGTNGDESPLEHETIERGVGRSFWHPSVDYRHFHKVPEGVVIPLLEQRFRKGKVLGPHPDLKTIRTHVREELDRFDGSYLRLLNPHGYKVAITEKLKDLKLGLIQSYLGDM